MATKKKKGVELEAVQFGIEYPESISKNDAAEAAKDLLRKSGYKVGDHQWEDEGVIIDVEPKFYKKLEREGFWEKTDLSTQVSLYAETP